MNKRITVICRACGDAENCDFYCTLTIPKGVIDIDNLVCPISGDECEWDEVKDK